MFQGLRAIPFAHKFSLFFSGALSATFLTAGIASKKDVIIKETVTKQTDDLSPDAMTLNKLSTLRAELCQEQQGGRPCKTFEEFLAFDMSAFAPSKADASMLPHRKKQHRNYREAACQVFANQPHFLCRIPDEYQAFNLAVLSWLSLDEKGKPAPKKDLLEHLSPKRR